MDVCASIAILFNSMLNHSVLPDDMIYSLLVPLVKDNSAALDNKSNYRAIALSTSLSKLLELILVERLSPFLRTSDAQFGFKAEHSTTLATYVLKETVNFYTSHGSPVYACFLDASKAFDRVCHSTLFRILADRGVPMPYLQLLIAWYSSQKMGVKWANSESDPFCVQNGVRQGGNLSPMLFNVYIDTLLCDLRKMKMGCFVGHCAVNVLAYADDLVLLAPTRAGLQALVDVCVNKALSLDIKFNIKKTVCMMFLPQKPYSDTHLRHAQPPCIYLDGSKLTWVNEFKYLGHMITCGLNDAADMRRAKRSLYYSVNMICAKLGFADKHVLVKLFRAFCTNMYGCELWDMVGEKKVTKELHVAYHSCLKKLVKVPRWSRNHNLCHEVHVLTCPMLIAYRQFLFWCRIASSNNSIVCGLVNSGIGEMGLLAKNHMYARFEYDLVELDLCAVTKADLRNIFDARLERIVQNRLEGQGSDAPDMM